MRACCKNPPRRWTAAASAPLSRSTSAAARPRKHSSICRRPSTAQKDAMSSLLEAMDLPPTTKLRVASVSGRPLPPLTARTIDDVLQEALRRRPELLADVAKLRASDAGITAARSDLFPKVSLGA